MMESLNTYDYQEQLGLKPRVFEVAISDLDKVIKIMEDGSLLAELGLDLSDGILSLTGKEGMNVASVELPGSEVLKGGLYDKDSQEIVLYIINADKSETEIRIDVADLVDVYTAGQGININEEKEISIKIKENSNTILDVNEEGLGINLSEYSTLDDLNEEKVVRENADIILSNAINSLEGQLDTEVAIRIHCDELLATNLSAETTERELSDTLLSDRIDAETFNRNEVDESIMAVVDTKVPYTKAIKDGVEYNVIKLDNHANLIGESTEGVTYNLAMVSKWDVADFGSASLHTNLNSVDKITVNDSEKLAYMSDIEDLGSGITVDITVIKNDLTSIHQDISVIENEIININNNINEEVLNRQEGDALLKDMITEETARAIGAEDALNTKIEDIVSGNLSERIEENKANIVLLNEKLDNEILAVNTKFDGEITNLNTKVDAVNTKIDVEILSLNEKVDEEVSSIYKTIGEGFNEIKPLITALENDKVSYTKTIKDGVEVRNITLDNDASLMALSNGGGSHNIASLSKTNVMEIGTLSMPMNLRSKERITVNYNEQVAYVSELNGSSSDLAEKIEANKVAIETEVIRATAKEGELEAATLLEQENRISNDRKLNAFIVTETNRAKSVEDGLSENIATTIGLVRDEMNRAKGVELEISNNLDTEIERATSNETRIETKVDKKVDWVDISTPQAVGRKSIVLENNDILLGKNVDGVVTPLIFLNKWNVVDAGASNIKFNINTPHGIRPTVQEAGQTGDEANKIAYLSDIEKLTDDKVSTVELIQDAINPLHYLLMVDGENKGDINIPKDQFLKEAKYDAVDKKLVFVFETSEGEKEVSVDVSDLIDTYTAGEGLLLNLNEFSIDFTTVAKKDKLDGAIDYFKSADRTLQGNIDKEATRAIEAEEELKNTKVSWEEFGDEGRKTIILKNNDMLLGTDMNGATYNLAMVSKWDIVDLGSTSLPLNFNSSVVPTVQFESGVKHIALSEDVSIEMGNIVNDYKERDAVLDTKIDNTLEDSKDYSDEKLNESKEYTDEQVGKINTDIDSRIAAQVDPLKSKFDNYLTTEQVVEELNGNLAASKLYTDEKIASEIGKIDGDVDNKIAIAVSASEQKLSVEIIENSDDILKLSTGLDEDVYTGGTGIVDDVYRITHDLIFDLDEADLKGFLHKNMNSYKNGNGINIEFSRLNINIDETSESFLTVSSEGLKLSGVNDAIVAQSQIVEDTLVDEINRIDEALVNEATRTDNNLAAESTRIMTVVDTKVPYTKAIKDGVEYNVIALANHANLVGEATSGGTYNLAMVSKWDVADFGSASLHTNLNSVDKVTVNDTEKLAYMSDIDTLSGGIAVDLATIKEGMNIEMVNRHEGDLELGEKITSEATRVDAKFVAASDETNELVMAESVRAQEALTEESNRLETLLLNETKRAELVEGVLRTDADKLRVDVDYESSRALGAEANINAALETKVTWDESGKKITLAEGGMLTGTMANVVGVEAGVNLVMVNAWNVVDLGSSKLPINLNVPASVRPTVQEAGQSGEQANKIAYLSDVDTKVSSVELVQDELNTLHYSLMVDGVKTGDINIPKDQFLKSASFDETTHTLTFVFETSNGEETVTVDLKSLMDVYKAGNGLSLLDGEFNVVIDPSTQSFIEVGADGIKIVGVNEAIEAEKTRAEAAEKTITSNLETTTAILQAFVEMAGNVDIQLEEKIDANTKSIEDEESRAKDIENAIDGAVTTNAIAITKIDSELTEETIRAKEIETKLRTDLDYESSRALEAESNINNALVSKVTWAEGNTKIVLPSGGQLVATEFGADPLKGATMAQLNEWGVMDFGSPKYLLNLNVPDGKRATVQEKSQSGEQANEIAYVSDFSNYVLKSDYEDLLARIIALENK